MHLPPTNALYILYVTRAGCFQQNVIKYDCICKCTLADTYPYPIKCLKKYPTTVTIDASRYPH